MKYPLWQAARVGDHAEHGAIPEGRRGAGDEGTGSDVAGDSAKDHVDSGHNGPAPATLASVFADSACKSVERFSQNNGKHRGCDSIT
jgi:hypothetical protein